MLLTEVITPHCTCPSLSGACPLQLTVSQGQISPPASSASSPTPSPPTPSGARLLVPSFLLLLVLLAPLLFVCGVQFAL